MNALFSRKRLAPAITLPYQLDNLDNLDSLDQLRFVLRGTIYRFERRVARLLPHQYMSQPGYIFALPQQLPIQR